MTKYRYLYRVINSRVPSMRMTFYFYMLGIVLLVSCHASLKYSERESKNQAQVIETPERVLNFSGFEWIVRDSKRKPQGPGDNVFSNSKDNVWVDDMNRLHLKIIQKKNRWHCAEIRLNKPFGYGTYIFRIQTDLSTLDENVVAGLFTYLHDTAEVDIEFSKWSKSDNLNAQYVVQPAETKGNIRRFNVQPDFERTQHSFHWREDSILFESIGFKNSNEKFLNRWTYKGASIPKEDTEGLRINLWLYKGQAPKNQQEVEIIVESVHFIP